MSAEYLTIAEVASELGLTTSGVYKLIERDKLKAVRRSERGMRVSRIALDAYRRRLRGRAVEPPAGETTSIAELLTSFQRETGVAPAAWEQRWKADQLEDSAENMRITVRALALRAAELELSGGQEPAADWLIAAARRR